MNRMVELVPPHWERGFTRCRFRGEPPGFDGDGRSGGDHAGRVETSLGGRRTRLLGCFANAATAFPASWALGSVLVSPAA